MLILSAESAEKDIQKSTIIKILNDKGIVVMPCDTIYGFVGVAPDTNDRIASIKGRPGEKKFLQLILPHWLSDFTEYRIEEELIKLSPGRITFIVENRKGSTDAVRFPKDHLLKSVLFEVGKPLYSTSVNRSGKDILFRSKDIVREFGSEIDLFVDAGDIPGKVPSTILDVTSRPYKVIREGLFKVPEKFLT